MTSKEKAYQRPQVEVIYWGRGLNILSSSLSYTEVEVEEMHDLGQWDRDPDQP